MFLKCIPGAIEVRPYGAPAASHPPLRPPNPCLYLPRRAHCGMREFNVIEGEREMVRGSESCKGAERKRVTHTRCVICSSSSPRNLSSYVTESN